MNEQMNERKSFFLQYMGDTPRIRILDFLMDNFNHDFSLPQIAKGSNVAYTTLMGIFPQLERLGMVIETRKIGKSRLYKINKYNPAVKVLFVVDMRLADAIMKQKEEKQLVWA